MVQRFALNKEMPAEDQIRETEFDIQKGDVNIYYHYKEGKVTAKEKSFKRKDLIGDSSSMDVSKKFSNQDHKGKDDNYRENAKQQEQKKIHEMEIDCHHQINGQEENAGAERDARVTKEKEIMSMG